MLAFVVFRGEGGVTRAIEDLGGDPGPVHVHGLGVNPADGALFIATHTGLWRVDPGDTTAERVSDRRQDTMGFSVVGPRRYLGSGHPDVRDLRNDVPPLLGLIVSNDGGRKWRSVSLPVKPTSTSCEQPPIACTASTLPTGSSSRPRTAAGPGSGERVLRR